MRKHTISGNPFLGKYGDLLLLHIGRQVEISPKMRPDAANLNFWKFYFGLSDFIYIVAYKAREKCFGKLCRKLVKFLKDLLLTGE